MTLEEATKHIVELLNKLPAGHQLLKPENKQWCISTLVLNRFCCYEVNPVTPFCDSPVEALVLFFITRPYPQNT